VAPPHERNDKLSRSPRSSWTLAVCSLWDQAARDKQRLRWRCHEQRFQRDELKKIVALVTAVVSTAQPEEAAAGECRASSNLSEPCVSIAKWPPKRGRFASRLDWPTSPHRLAVKVTALSRLQRGFESRWGQSSGG
jgi:hypothetical protein